MSANFNEPESTIRNTHISDQNGDVFQFLTRIIRSGTVFLSLFTVFISLFLTPGCRQEDKEQKYQRLMQSAEQFQKEKKWDEARIQLQAAIDAKPKSAEAHFALAEIFVHQQNIKRAVELYTSALNHDPNHRGARLHLAAILIAAKQYELAETHIQKLLDADPKDNDTLILKANLEAHGQRKDVGKATEILQEVLNRLPDSVPALASLAQIEVNQGKNKEAEEHFVRAVSIEPENAPLQLALADLYSREGRLDEAQAAMEKLVQKNPDQSGLRYIFGEFLLRRGLADQALAQYEETIRKDPRRSDARDRLYDMYLIRKQPDKAKELTASLINAAPTDPAVPYFKGRDLQAVGKNNEALALYLEAMKNLNNFAPLFRHAGLLELSLGQEREALEHLHQTVSIDPGDVGARLALARTFFAKKDLAQAVENLDQILNRYPSQLAANVLRADIALVQGDTSKARGVYQYLIKYFSNEPAGYFKLGLLEEKENHPDEAIKLYRQALAFDQNVMLPGRRLIILLGAQKKDVNSIINELTGLRNNSQRSKAEYNFLIGSLILAHQDDPQRIEKARSYLNQALEQKSDLIGAYFALAAIDAQSGNYDAAIENYKKLLEKNPKHVPTRMLLSYAYEQKGNYQDAANQYREILKDAPRFAPAANNLAWIIADELHGDLNEALQLAETAKEQLPKEPSIGDTLGWIHFLRGSPRAALPFIEEALELYQQSGPGSSPNPEILYHLAEVQAALNNKQEAKEAIDRAITIGGDKHPKYKKMDQLRKSLS